MSFYDIKTRWEYLDFVKQSREQKPYRGHTMPRYPLGNRRYSDRYWTPVIDFEKVKADYGVDHKEAIENWNSYADCIETYYGPYRLLTYYKDNTVEFCPNMKSYCQGETQILSRLLPGWVGSKVQYGGMMFHHKHSGQSYPVYHGMRIRICDGKPVKDYEVHVNQLDRKLTAPVRKKYDKFFKIAGAMLRSMGDEAIYKELVEIHNGNVPLRATESGTAITYNFPDVEQMINLNDPAGSVLNLVMRYDWAQTRYRISYWPQQHFPQFCTHSQGGENLLKGVKESFFTELYKDGMRKGENYLKTVVYTTGEKLGTCYWGHKMFVDGQQVERVN